VSIKLSYRITLELLISDQQVYQHLGDHDAVHRAALTLVRPAP